MRWWDRILRSPQREFHSSSQMLESNFTLEKWCDEKVEGIGSEKRREMWDGKFQIPLDIKISLELLHCLRGRLRHMAQLAHWNGPPCDLWFWFWYVSNYVNRRPKKEKRKKTIEESRKFHVKFTQKSEEKLELCAKNQTSLPHLWGFQAFQCVINKFLVRIKD